MALSIYLLVSCGKRDLLRALFGTILVAGIIYGLEWILPADPEEVLIDNMYVYGVVAGIVAYALGRSRRNAFVSCLFGITLAQLVQWIINMCVGEKSILGLGVGGAFSTYIVAIIISVALSEFLGRAFESAYGNKEKKVYNYKTHTYDSDKNGKLEKVQHTNEERISDFDREFASIDESLAWGIEGDSCIVFKNGEYLESLSSGGKSYKILKNNDMIEKQLLK